jgi:hypothetical protein
MNADLMAKKMEHKLKEEKALEKKRNTFGQLEELIHG